MIRSVHTGKIARTWSTFYLWLTTIFEGKKQKSTIASLDGVRAIACLIVVAYHLTLMTTKDVPLWKPSQFPGWFDALAFAGDTGVNLFFILSGFLLFLPYAKALLFQAPWPSIGQFYLRRALRILPAYYVSFFLMLLIYHPEYFHRDHLRRIVLFLTLFLDSSPETFKQINGPFWTLAVEWQFYLWLPLLAFGIGLLVRRGGLKWRLFSLTFCLSLMATWGLLTRYIGVYVTDHPGTTFHLPRVVFNVFLFLFYGIPTAGLHGKFFENFAVGMFISTLYILIRAYPPDSKLAKRFLRLSPWLFVLGITLLFLMSIWKYNQRVPHTWPIIDPLLSYYPTFGEFGYGIGYALCILAILQGPGLLKGFFEWRPLRWLGLLTFGLYMWHLLMLQAFMNLFVRPHYLEGWKHAILYGSYWLWLFFVIVPCMFLLFVTVERPFMLLGDRFRGKASTRSVTAATNLAQPAPDIVPKENLQEIAETRPKDVVH